LTHCWLRFLPPHHQFFNKHYMKIAHIADVHIRKLRYHQEYKEVFSQLYEKLREERVACTVIVGDIVHTKTDMSPEMVSLTSDFFSNLASISPTYIILGNHDGNLKNSSRQDAITPIVETLNHPDVYLLKNSGEVLLSENKSFEMLRDLTGVEYALNVLSVFDRDNWQKPSNPKNVNIALYHGSISNCKTDLNWVMEHGEDNINIFDDFDYAMLGDIHKRQSLDADGRIRYCGSTVQQNHGETNDKGFLIWDIKGKDDFTVEHFELKNPKPFITIELTPKGKIPRGTRLQEGARLRLVSNNNLPLEAIRKAADIAKRRFKPESVTFLNRAAGQRGSVEDITNSIFKEDLRDPAVQKELIDEYLKDYQADSEVLQRVQDLNLKYNTAIEKEEEVARNVNWKLLSLEWDNLFNYGEDNKIEFDNLNGVVGILGKNFSGKSSIIDSLLFTLFNSTSKNSRKNLNIINQNKEIGRGRAEILVNGKVYSVERESEKYTKKLKGEETLEAKTDLNFKFVDELGQIVSKNGLSRNDTDKNIRKVFGTLEDFLLTSMASQHGALSFISEGSTRRKEILAKFLDLELFEKKFKIAKEEASDLRGALKRVEDRDFETELAEAQEQLEANEAVTTDKKKECYNHTLELEIQKGELDALSLKLQSVPAEIIDINSILSSLSEKAESIQTLGEESRQIKIECDEKRALYEKITAFMETFNIESYRKKEEEITQLNESIDQIQGQIDSVKTQKGIHQKKVSLLSEVPCGEEFSHCKFIKDAYSSKKQIPTILEELESYNSRYLAFNNDLHTYDAPKVREYIEKYDQVVEKRDMTANQIAQCELKVQKNNNKIMILENEVKELNVKKELYENNKEAIENYSDLLDDKKEIQKRIKKCEKQISKCEDALQDLLISHGGFVERVENIRKQQVDLQMLREEYEAFDLFMRCMHPNGISYDIIKKRLPIINDEIAKVLANVVDFEVFFEEDGNRLNIQIKHPKHDPRPLEMGSGAEKSIAAMAIRLALLSVSTLPKPNFFILDEPGTSLDEENMEGFVKILDLTKSYFDKVFLISHLDSLKDCVDTQLVIEKKGNYAHIRT